MKNKKIFLFIFIISLIFLSKVNALPESLIELNEQEYNYTNITNMISTKDTSFILSNNKDTTIYSYTTNNELIASKKFNSLKNSNIIKYNDYILLAGIKGNKLTIYLLDSTLRVITTKETSYIINSKNKLNLSLYNNKVYLNLTNNNILTTNNIYEIDENLNIIENTFSYYDNIKDILNNTYYLIKYNNTNIEDSITTYNSSTKFYGKEILVGTNNNQGIISIYDDTNLINYTIDNKYTTYKKILTIKNMLTILAYDNELNSYLIFIDENNNTILEESISLNGNPISNIYKVGENLYLVNEINNKTYLKGYHCNLDISHNNLPYGTINTIENASIYDKVPIEVIANSGYEVASIEITDSYGNSVPIIENTFTMPDTDIKIAVTYNETVINPDTVDYICIIFIILIISVFSIRFFYKKFAWLK